MKKHLHILFFAMLTLVSYGNQNRIEFFGETIRVDYPERVEILTNGRAIELGRTDIGFMHAFDEMLMSIPFQHRSNLAYLFDVETGRRTNAILPMGRGQNEIISFGFYDNFEKDANGVHLWISAFNDGKLIRINTQGEFVEVIPTEKFSSTNPFGISIFFMLNDSMLIASMQGRAIVEDGNEFISPSWRVFNKRTGEMVREFKFYSDYSLEITDSRVLLMFPSSYLYGPARIKPDRSKLAIAMVHLGRLNIFDIESGNIKSIETKNSPDLNFISLGRPVPTHFQDLFVDDDFIFVVESTLAERTEANAWHWFETMTRPSGRILVYDWNGNFLRILQIEGYIATNFAFDPIRKTLYTRANCGQIMAYDLNFLYR